MNTLVWVFAVVLTVVGATVGSVRRVNQGNEALVERLGRYHRKLTPGLNFGVLPIIDEVVIEANTRERILDIEPSDVITNDSVTLTIDTVIFWRIIDLYSAYYEIDDVSTALKNLVGTTLRSKIGEMDLQRTYSSREEINRALLESLDDATEPWGVKVTRVEIQDIKIKNEDLQKSLESERAALSKNERRLLRQKVNGKRRLLRQKVIVKRRLSRQKRWLSQSGELLMQCQPKPTPKIFCAIWSCSATLTPTCSWGKATTLK